MSASVAALIRVGLSVPDVAVSLSVSTRKVWELIATGELKARKLGRRTIVEPAALREYVENLPRRWSAPV